MSRMKEQYQDEQDRDNLSGMDDCLAWHEYNRSQLNQISAVTDGIVVEGKQHRKTMADLGLVNGFNEIFTGERK